MTVEYLVILTLDKPGYAKNTQAFTVAIPREQTRADLLFMARQRMPAEMRDGTVDCFYAEPNSLVSEADTRSRGGAVTS